jgi:orotidine-5'-phosphate decarboxylase
MVERAQAMNSRPNPLFVALDVDSAERALELIHQTRAFVGGFKLGPRLVMRYGQELTREVARHGALFIDCKFYDIPNVMEHSVRTAFELGATYCTVHAQAGKEALTRVAQLEQDLRKLRPFRVLSVTILTSFRQDTLAPNVQHQPLEEQALTLAELSLSCGLSGLVCSAEEVEKLRARYPEAYLLTPGIRLGLDDKGDQKRVSDPLTALRKGASALVVGRPICDSLEPAQAAKVYYEEIQKH